MGDVDRRSKEKRNQRAENRAESNDDGVCNAEAESPDRDTEENLRDTPTCSECQRSDKGGCSKASIGREEMVTTTSNADTDGRITTDNAEDEPQIFHFHLRANWPGSMQLPQGRQRS